MKNLLKNKCILCGIKPIKNLSTRLDDPFTYQKYCEFLSSICDSLDLSTFEYFDAELCVTCFDHHLNENQDYIDKHLLKQRLLR